METSLEGLESEEDVAAASGQSISRTLLARKEVTEVSPVYERMEYQAMFHCMDESLVHFSALAPPGFSWSDNVLLCFLFRLAQFYV
jgi:hypothetical protein